MPLHCPDSMNAVVRFFNEMTPAKLEHLGDVYSPGVTFNGPIHQARGLAQLREVLATRFEKLENFSVELLDAHGDERTGFLLWTVNYQQHGKARAIHGMSHFCFAVDGRISEQRDQWDATSVLQGERPVLSWLMQKINRRPQISPQKAGK